jgi:hypothetical protein
MELISVNLILGSCTNIKCQNGPVLLPGQVFILMIMALIVNGLLHPLLSMVNPTYNHLDHYLM